MLDRGEAHIVNTASVHGLVGSSGRNVAAYTSSRFACVGLSDALRIELAPNGIEVTVLCPGLVTTRPLEAGRNRSDRLGGPERAPESVLNRPNSSLRAGLEPALVAKMVLEAIHEYTFCVVTGPNLPGLRARVWARFHEILAAYDAAPA